MEKHNQSKEKDEKRSSSAGTSTTKKVAAEVKSNTGSKTTAKSGKGEEGKSVSRASGGTKDSGKSK